MNEIGLDFNKIKYPVNDEILAQRVLDDQIEKILPDAIDQIMQRRDMRGADPGTIEEGLFFAYTEVVRSLEKGVKPTLSIPVEDIASLLEGGLLTQHPRDVTNLDHKIAVEIDVELEKVFHQSERVIAELHELSLTDVVPCPSGDGKRRGDVEAFHQYHQKHKIKESFFFNGFLAINRDVSTEDIVFVKAPDGIFKEGILPKRASQILPEDFVDPEKIFTVDKGDPYVVVKSILNQTNEDRQVWSLLADTCGRYKAIVVKQVINPHVSTFGHNSRDDYYKGEVFQKNNAITWDQREQRTRGEKHDAVIKILGGLRLRKDLTAEQKQVLDSLLAHRTNVTNFVINHF